MNNVAFEINKQIKDTKEYQEYICLKKQIQNNQEIKELLAKIKTNQHQLKKLLSDDKISEYKAKQKELEDLKNIFLNHPLINNYLQAKQLLYNLVEQVATIIGQ